jgi:hypothetical protein
MGLEHRIEAESGVAIAECAPAALRFLAATGRQREGILLAGRRSSERFTEMDIGFDQQNRCLSLPLSP